MADYSGMFANQMDMSFAVDGLIAGAAQDAASAPDKAVLVQRVKDWQRQGPEAKEQWWAYCKASGNTNFDPGRHEAPFLQGFFDYAEGRAAMPTKGSSKGGGGGAKMFIGGLPKTTTDEKVYELFGHYGTVTEVMLKYSDEGLFRGFGFVSFQDPASVEAAIAGTSDNMIDGKWVDCKNANEISKGGGGGKKGGKDGGKGKKGGKGGGKGWDMDPWQMMNMFMTMMKGKKGGKGGGGKGKGPY